MAAISAGARSAIAAAVGTSRSGPGPSRRARAGSTLAPQRRTIRRWISAARDGLDQLLGDRPGERLPRPRAAAGPQPGALAQRRPQQRVALELLEELREVVIDAEGEPHPLERELERRGSASAAPPGSALRPPAAARRGRRPGRRRRAGAGSAPPCAGAWSRRRRSGGAGGRATAGRTSISRDAGIAAM